MTKLTSILLFLSLFASCAHQVGPLKVSAQKDAFRTESFQRSSDLNKTALTNELEQLMASCLSTNLNQSLESFSTALDTYQENPLYWGMMGACYLHHQDLPKALFVTEMGLGRKPQKEVKAFLLNNRGVIHLKNRHFERAKQDFEEALKANPQSVTTRFNLSLIYIQFGHTGLAEALLARLHREHPQDEEILALSGIVQLLQNRQPEAESYFVKLSEGYRRRSDLSLALAINALELDRPEEAKHILLRQASTSLTHLKRMTLVTQKRINQKLEMKREQEELAKRTPAQQ